MGNIVFRRVRGHIVALLENKGMVMRLPSRLQSQVVRIQHFKKLAQAVHDPNSGRMILSTRKDGQTVAQEISALAKKLRGPKA